jgi:hypothetical protein
LRRAASVTTLPTRTATQLRHTYVNLGLIVCPLISGLFFGLIATVLGLVSGNGNALEVGALTGFVILTANALALCLVMSRPMEEHRPAIHARPPRTRDAAGQRAS